MKKNVNNTICIISQYFPPDNTGDSIRLIKVVKALKKIGYKVIIITAFPHYPDGKIPQKYKKKLIVRERWNEIDIIRTYVLPLSHKGMLKKLLTYCSFSFSAIIALFYVKKAKFIWAFSQKLFSYFTGIVYKFVLKAPLLLDVVDIWPEGFVNAGLLDHKNKILLKILRITLNIFYRIADDLITLNPAMKKLLVISANIKPSKISILPNITYPDEFKPLKINRHPYENKFVVMYSGNLGLNYDFMNVFKAASILRNNEEIKFIIKATGDKNIESALKKYIKTNHLDNIHFEEKFLGTQEFIRFLNLADVFILPMKKCIFPDTSFPSKLIDYISLGKPVIYSGIGYSAFLIRKFKLGMAIKASDPQELSKAILYIKNNEELRKEMGKNARRATYKFFSPKILEKKIKEILKH